jgi:tetratricopeptide (TPR) repeat protein
MIVIGSFALALLGHKPVDDVRDLDLVGTAEDVERFRELHRAIIAGERAVFDHRHAFLLKPGNGVEKVEIDFEQSESDRMLPALCRRKATVLGLEVGVPPVEVLYLLKRAQGNVPVHYEKSTAGMLALKPLIGKITARQDAFYRARKREIAERFALHRQRFTLSIRNEDFFDNSDHIRFYVHDDLHEVVAHHPEGPLYRKCKRDLTLAKIDTDLFEQLSPADQLRMVQEEFMVIGLERYFVPNRELSAQQVYERGMHKTIRDLFVGYFQDFCLDHLDELLAAPPFDFTARFGEAERGGKLRQVQIEIGPWQPVHKEIWQLTQTGQPAEARRRAEDLVRSAEHGIDSHAWFLLGVSLLLLRDLKPAEKCLRMCLGRDRQNKLAWFYLGATLRTAGRMAEAVQALNTAAKFGFAQSALHWNLGLAFEGQRMPGKAIEAYKRASELNPQDPRPAQRIAAIQAAVA